jgi:redox-sensitive bicupin YhaK (pirin superfamily)
MHATKAGHSVFVYVIEGQAYFCQEKNPFAYEVEGANSFDIQRNSLVTNESLVLFDAGDQVVVSTEEEPVRFLLASGQPIGEPVAWQGLIVMNSREELQIAFEEYRNGTFLKHQTA